MASAAHPELPPRSTAPERRSVTGAGTGAPELRFHVLRCGARAPVFQPCSVVRSGAAERGASGADGFGVASFVRQLKGCQKRRLSNEAVKRGCQKICVGDFVKVFVVAKFKTKKIEKQARSKEAFELCSLFELCLATTCTTL